MSRDALSRVRRQVIEEALAIEREDAVKAGALIFMARLFCCVALPNSDPARREGVPASLRHFWERKNGMVSLAMAGNPKIGLPYGKVPRVLLAWLTTEAVRTREPQILLGDTLSAFLQELDMGAATGGPTGTITRFTSQIQRLLTTAVSATLDFIEPQGFKVWELRNLPLARASRLCWHPRHPDQRGLWNSHITLSAEFFEMAIERPVPIDRRILKRLRSSLALDLYLFLTYRLSYLDAEREIPWALLRQQFGSDFGSTKAFRRNVLAKLRVVLELYPAARVAVGTRGLILKPSPPQVPRLISGGCGK